MVISHGVKRQRITFPLQEGQFKHHRVDDLQFVEEQKKSAKQIGEIASFLSRKFISSSDM